MKLKLAAFFCVLLGAGWAVAQDRTIALGEAGVVATGADITIQPDGGCLIQARGTNDAGVEILHRQHSFNGGRCTTVKAALLQCLKTDLGVGTGAEP